MVTATFSQKYVIQGGLTTLLWNTIFDMCIFAENLFPTVIYVFFALLAMVLRSPGFHRVRLLFAACVILCLNLVSQNFYTCRNNIRHFFVFFLSKLQQPCDYQVYYHVPCPVFWHECELVASVCFAVNQPGYKISSKYLFCDFAYLRCEVDTCVIPGLINRLAFMQRYDPMFHRQRRPFITR